MNISLQLELFSVFYKKLNSSEIHNYKVRYLVNKTQ